MSSRLVGPWLPAPVSYNLSLVRRHCHRHCHFVIAAIIVILLVVNWCETVCTLVSFRYGSFSQSQDDQRSQHIHTRAHPPAIKDDVSLPSRISL